MLWVRRATSAGCDVVRQDLCEKRDGGRLSRGELCEAGPAEEPRQERAGIRQENDPRSRDADFGTETAGEGNGSEGTLLYQTKYMELKMKSGMDSDRACVEAMVKDHHDDCRRFSMRGTRRATRS
jgi:hypothetical protein